MIAGGITFLIVGIILLLFGGIFTDDSGKITFVNVLMGFFSGLLIILALNCLLPPFKDRTNDEFKVETKSVPTVQKEIFINVDGKSDTTYYYIFENGTVKENIKK